MIVFTASIKSFESFHSTANLGPISDLTNPCILFSYISYMIKEISLF